MQPKYVAGLLRTAESLLLPSLLQRPSEAHKWRWLHCLSTCSACSGDQQARLQFCNPRTSLPGYFSSLSERINTAALCNLTYYNTAIFDNSRLNDPISTILFAFGQKFTPYCITKTLKMPEVVKTPLRSQERPHRLLR